jgi:hypothetical protein
MSIYGNTVILRGTFTDTDLTPVDPTDITLTIFNKFKQEVTSFEITDTDKISTGIYEYYYNLPFGSNDLYYEYKGTIDGNIVLNRAKITRTWSE